jgi:hypothetical protein
MKFPEVSAEQQQRLAAARRDLGGDASDPAEKPKSPKRKPKEPKKSRDPKEPKET